MQGGSSVSTAQKPRAEIQQDINSTWQTKIEAKQFKLENLLDLKTEYFITHSEVYALIPLG